VENFTFIFTFEKQAGQESSVKASGKQSSAFTLLSSLFIRRS
jgi:hypothetical protein